MVGCLAFPWEKKHIPAIPDAWYPGEEGGNAVARILFGEVVPSGKLTVSVPQIAGHLPVFYNYKPSGKGIYHKPETPGNPGIEGIQKDRNPSIENSRSQFPNSMQRAWALG